MNIRRIYSYPHIQITGDASNHQYFFGLKCLIHEEMHVIEYPYAHTFPSVHDIFLKPFGFKLTLLICSYDIFHYNHKRLLFCLPQLNLPPRL